MSQFSPLEKAIGWQFHDTNILISALAHRSYCSEHPDVQSYERLEFLGDAILGMTVTDQIYRNYPELQEGEMAKLRASVVNAETLSEIARELHIGEYMFLGRGEEASGGREKSSILADMVEAVIAAVYLDGGLEAAWPVITNLFTERIAEAGEDPGEGDFKTRLQEISAQKFQDVPRYTVRAEGPDHAREFFAEVTLKSGVHGSGSGSSKKQAEQQAAKQAWEAIHSEEDASPNNGGHHARTT